MSYGVIIIYRVKDLKYVHNTGLLEATQRGRFETSEWILYIYGNVTKMAISEPGNRAVESLTQHIAKLKANVTYSEKSVSKQQHT